MEKITYAVALSVALMVATWAQAVPVVEIYTPANVGINSINVTFDSNTSTITIDENWTNPGPGYLKIYGLELDQTYLVKKIIHNNTGINWVSFANELLDPYNGPNSEDRRDRTPYPSWVPSGFTTSNNFDGLSFAEGSGIPRTSTVFPCLKEDELTDARDFLDFYSKISGKSVPCPYPLPVDESDSLSGILLAGGEDTISYGLRLSTDINQPFLLAQRPNTFSVPPPSVPEPASLALLGIGLGGLVLKRYRQQRS